MRKIKTEEKSGKMGKGGEKATKGIFSRLSLEKMTRPFRSLASMSRWKKAGLALVAVALVAVGVFMSDIFGIKAASYSWLQTDWSVGADTVNFPNHTSNQSGWTKFFSKDSNVDVTTSPGDVKLTQATGTALQTSDTGTGDTPNAGGFNAWTKPNAYVSGTGTSASLALSKPTGASCTTTPECATGLVCRSSLCQSPWVSGYCGIDVYYADVSGTKQWKTAQTSCVGPQCATGLDSSYPSNYSLVADNGVTFTGYTARIECQNLGGRLPRMSELSCIYTNRANLGTFQTNYYWSATEYYTRYAYLVYFANGSASYNDKTSSACVRCVR